MWAEENRTHEQIIQTECYTAAAYENITYHFTSCFKKSVHD